MKTLFFRNFSVNFKLKILNNSDAVLNIFFFKKKKKNMFLRNNLSVDENRQLFQLSDANTRGFNKNMFIFIYLRFASKSSLYNRSFFFMRMIFQAMKLNWGS